MYTETYPSVRHTAATRATRRHRAGRALLGCLVASTVTGLSGETPVGAGSETSPVAWVGTNPDAVADHTGGIAARLHDKNGRPIAGDVFLLIGPGDTPVRARVFDETPYTHALGTHPDTIASNALANQTVQAVTGTAVELIDMTNGPGGGPSGGLTRAIAYLNVVSDGAFTGELRVASTGELSREGQVRSIDYIDAKTVAADLADADVLFTPTLPSGEVRDAYAARVAGESFRDPATGESFNDPRRVEVFRRWGASRPAGLDIVDVRHLIDVSAYLCGGGSGFACDVLGQLDRLAQDRFDELAAEANSELARFRSASGQPAAS